MTPSADLHKAAALLRLARELEAAGSEGLCAARIRVRYGHGTPKTLRRWLADFRAAGYRVQWRDDGTITADWRG